MKLHILNVILPFFFFELKYVLIALVFVVLIETFIVKHFIKQGFGFLFQTLIFANIATTLFGYFLQGALRMVITLLFNIQSKNPIVAGLTGNIGVESGWTATDNLSVLVSIVTSILIALLLSIYCEKKILVRMYEGKVEETGISKGVRFANIVSYSLLFVWIYFNYRYM
jgi:hypothetical protein